MAVPATAGICATLVLLTYDVARRYFPIEDLPLLVELLEVIVMLLNFFLHGRTERRSKKLRPYRQPHSHDSCVRFCTKKAGM